MGTRVVPTYANLFMANLEEKIPFKIDTGAQVNMLPKSDFDKLSILQPLTQSTVTLRGYGGRELDTLGTCDLNCM